MTTVAMIKENGRGAPRRDGTGRAERTGSAVVGAVPPPPTSGEAHPKIVLSFAFWCQGRRLLLRFEAALRQCASHYWPDTFNGARQ